LKKINAKARKKEGHWWQCWLWKNYI